MSNWQWQDHNSSNNASECSPFPGALIYIRCMGDPKNHLYNARFSYKKPGSSPYVDSIHLVSLTILNGGWYPSNDKFVIKARTLAEAKRKTPPALKRAMLHMMEQHQSLYQTMLGKLIASEE